MGAISVLNVFIVPIVSLAIMKRRSTIMVESGMQFLLNYGVIVVCVNILTYIELKVVEIVTGIGPLLESHMYTIFSVVVAFLFPYVWEIIKKYINIKCEIKEKKK